MCWRESQESIAAGRFAAAAAVVVAVTDTERCSGSWRAGSGTGKPLDNMNTKQQPSTSDVRVLCRKLTCWWACEEGLWVWFSWFMVDTDGMEGTKLRRPFS